MKKCTLHSLSCCALVFLFYSCATPRDPKTVKKIKKKDIILAFDINNEKFKKFKVVPKKNVVAVVAKKKQLPKKAKKKSSKSKTLSKETKVEVPVLPSDVAPVVISSPKGYPDDFPEEIKQLDKNSKKIWNELKPIYFPGEKSNFIIHYLGFKIGNIILSSGSISSIDGKDTFLLRASLKSADYYSYIYSLDDIIESYVDVKKFLPIKYSLKQVESKQQVNDLQLFDHAKLKTYYWYKRVKKGKNKDDYKESFIPKYFQDSYSAFLFLRGLPLKIGSRYSIPIVNRAKYWILKIHVAGFENRKILGKKQKTIKVKAESYFPGVMKKKGDITLWYTADKKKVLVKFQAKIKLGHITGEIIKYSNSNSSY